MKKWRLLPLLAGRGVVQNGNVYYPYLVSCVFSVFTYFVFASILENDLIKTLPHSAYAWLMLSIGKALLGIILLAFLFYANSFLVKRRKKEMGLYSLLGLEKKHIGIMLFFEMLMIYGVSVCGGLLFGTVLAKFLFLLLLRLSSLPVDVEFTFAWKAVRETLLFFAAVFFVNFIYSLLGLQKARPAELLSGSRSGEKEPRFLKLWTAAGMLVLALGYTVAIRAKQDGMIFINFFLAVFLVIVGTYLLFTSGSIAFLKLMKKKKKIYYQPQNFITISGMYYRMKKSAAGLSNICIFSTMVIITLTCTVALYAGLDGIARYDNPYDVKISYDGEGISAYEVEKKAKELAAQYGMEIERMDSYGIRTYRCGKEGGSFVPEYEYTDKRYKNNHDVLLMTLCDYESLSGRNISLDENQVLMYGTGVDYGYDTVEFMGIKAEVKEEIKELFFMPKAGKNTFTDRFIIVVKDEKTVEAYTRAWAKLSGETDVQEFLSMPHHNTGVLVKGKDSEKAGFVEAVSGWCSTRTGYFMYCGNMLEGREILRSMNGGLLFIGLIFGLIFFMCLLLIMYYKQISEGYEDQNSFGIMQKVGMSEEEIRSTVKRQILTVFSLPLAGALVHAAVGMFMVNRLMSVLRMFDTRLLLTCEAGVCIFFILIYGISYVTTSRSYYQIVKG